jgi:tetratricopeptide (TPR) repeat protein
MMFRILLCAACVLIAGAARAADQLQYGPEPSWVVPTPIPKAPPNTDAAAVVLLQDTQNRFGAEQDEYYTETAIKVLSTQALASVGNVGLVWSPDTETMIVHHLRIIRDGKVIDLLAGDKKFTVIRREHNLELSTLDGALTATMQPEDLRVGDIVDLAVTKLRKDPVYQGRSEGGAAMERPGVLGRFRYRALWAASKPMRWAASDDLGKGGLTRTWGQNELVFDLTNVEAPKPPKDAPLRFSRLAQVQFTQFRDWAEVSALMAPLYRKAATLAPESPLRAEIERIKAASPDPKIRAEMALRLVQDQVRYVALLLNLGGYTPAAADLTWSRRFGDCKGKTALLLALLDGLGIEAEPALVNTTAGDQLSVVLPALSVFDHVLVRARIGGKVYWLDGTRLGDRHLDDIPVPAFHWALPVQAAGAVLEKLEPPPRSVPDVEVLVRLDASKGVDAPAPAHLELIYRGDAGIAMHLALSALNQADADRAMRDTWTKSYPWITAASVSSSYDEDRRVLTMVMDGSAKMDWGPAGTVRQFQIDESSLGYDASFHREPGPNLDAPYAVGYPAFIRSLVTVVLPDHGVGSSIGNAPDVDREIAGIRYQRTSKITNGVATMDVSAESLEPEFPASEAEADAAALRELVRTDVLISYSGSTFAPAQAVSPGGGSSAAQSSVDFSQRGLGHLAKREFPEAIADLSQAIRLDPKSASDLYDRGVAYLESGKTQLAIADFDAALGLHPSDPLALMARGQAYLIGNDDHRAKADFDAALKLAPGDYKILLRRADAYRQSGRADEAVGYYEALVEQFPGAEHQGAASGLCRARVAQGRDLDHAITDCDAAIQMKASDIAALAARAEAHLKLGHASQAVSDFDQVLAARPADTQAFCGRGAAKLAQGLKAEAETDFAKGRCKETAPAGR